MAKEKQNEKSNKKQEFEKELKRKSKKNKERIKEKDKEDTKEIKEGSKRKKIEKSIWEREEAKKEEEIKKEKIEEAGEKIENQKETIVENGNLESVTTRQIRTENTFQSIESFEPIFSRREFVAPVLGQTEETGEARLEETAQRAPAPVTTAQTNAQIYSTNTAERNIPYSPNSQYEESAVYRSKRQEVDRERRRFDVREGLIADTSRITPTLAPTIANPFIREGDRIMPQREDLEKFEIEQREYKEKIEKDTRRRRLR